MKALTQSEMDKLLASVEDERLRLMILLASRHGLRATECCRLLWSDIDLPNRTIRCRRLKGSNTSTQALGQNEVDALEAWRGRFRTPSKYVFPGDRKGAVSRITFWRQFHAACLAAGLPKEKAHCHVLKHYCAVRMVEANISLPIVQAALGHKNISSTAVYAQPSEEIVNQAMKGVFDDVRV